MARPMVYLCAFVLGVVLMGFEMIASRYLAPYFGTGVNTWAALIAVVLLAMTIGYFIGGYLVDRYPTLRLAAISAGLAALWLLLVPVASDMLLEKIMLAFDSEVTGVMVASCVLLLAPITCLGTFSPIAVRLMIHDIGTTGSTAGTIYGVSTFGNIVGTLGTALYVIPNIGSDTATYLFAAIALIAAGVLWFCASRLHVEQA
ncbi:hypothetical protein A7A08_02824 [Methyloligella halotolerans]|uniref:Major facilitator superfamily (MFS) profile domain-containing protein n=1 Tax=Methyloligella halotolerans TaxID=1177755 RepID=A0A1E2RVA9_9HYPH|nr:fused MFS/spermidine synthase [Methyloligella halotolerans]ODA66177.1 hypothetical protein A7A08_02824 [Methyloligella halotolerans]